MTRRRLFALLALVTLAVGVGTTGFAQAFFEDQSNDAQRVTTESPADWLHLYSEVTDPAQAGDYAIRLPAADSLGPAAEGKDLTLAIDLGRRDPLPDDQPDTGIWPAADRAFVLQTPATLPGGAASIDVAVRSENSGGDADHPLPQPTITDLDGTDPHTRVTMGPGERRQVNLAPNTSGLSPRTAYTSAIVITLRFADDSVLHYRVPVTLCTAVRTDGCA